jgi:hypothetical protein
MKHLLITIVLALSLFFVFAGTYSCIHNINSNRDLINAVLTLCPDDYTVEVLEDDPNRILISIEKGD